MTPWLNFGRSRITSKTPCPQTPCSTTRTARCLAASVLLVFLVQAFSVGANAAEIRIASWNIYWLTSEDPDHHRRKDGDYAKLARYANDLDADVIALQEVDRGLCPEGISSAAVPY